MTQTWRCIFGLHAYSQWADFSEYEREMKSTDVGAGIIEGVPYWIPIGKVLVQTRICADCGKKQSQRVRL